MSSSSKKELQLKHDDIGVENSMTMKSESILSSDC